MFFHDKTRGKMIDMHCHVLPAVDDGSKSMEQTMDMLRMAHEEGIEAIIATPHFRQGHHSASIAVISERIKMAQEIIDEQGLNIRLYPGNEIYYSDGVEDLIEQDRIFTLNQTDRVLVEFSPIEEYTYIRRALDSINMRGFVPVLAHVERYGCMLENPERVSELKGMGVEIQINVSGILGKHGNRVKKFLYRLIKSRHVDYVGTDAHNTDSRPPEFQECYQILKKKFDAEYIDEIFYANALAIIEAE